MYEGREERYLNLDDASLPWAHKLKLAKGKTPCFKYWRASHTKWHTPLYIYIYLCVRLISPWGYRVQVPLSNGLQTGHKELLINAILSFNLERLPYLCLISLSQIAPSFDFFVCLLLLLDWLSLLWFSWSLNPPLWICVSSIGKDCVEISIRSNAVRILRSYSVFVCLAINGLSACTFTIQHSLASRCH